MDFVRNIVVVLHLIGFAVTFGAWATEAFTRSFRTTRLMDYGLLVSLVTGLVLTAPWPSGYEPNYVKVGVKLVILLVITGLVGSSNARQKRTGDPAPRAVFGAVGALAVLAAGIGVVWT